MKPALPILALVFFATSCTTAYKSGQTPDDVYYSPEKKINSNEYVQRAREDDERQYRANRRNPVEDEYAYNDDRYLRMKVRNRQMWSNLDYYYNDPYALGYYGRPGVYTGIGLYGGNFWSPYSYYNAYNNWNYHYNPYYMPHGNVVVINPNTNPVYNRPRTMNLNTFNRGAGSTSSPKRSNNSYQTFDSRPLRNSNANSWGNDVRRSFGTNSNTSNNTYSAPSRSSSGSSGSSSSGSSAPRSAPVRKF